MVVPGSISSKIHGPVGLNKLAIASPSIFDKATPPGTRMKPYNIFHLRSQAQTHGKQHCFSYSILMEGELP
jgi:hypothetical protein